MNRRNKPWTRVDKEMVIVAPFGKSWPKTDKQNMIRPQVYKDFERRLMRSMRGWMRGRLLSRMVSGRVADSCIDFARIQLSVALVLRSDSSKGDLQLLLAATSRCLSARVRSNVELRRKLRRSLADHLALASPLILAPCNFCCFDEQDCIWPGLFVRGYSPEPRRIVAVDTRW